MYVIKYSQSAVISKIINFFVLYQKLYQLIFRLRDITIVSPVICAFAMP